MTSITAFPAAGHSSAPRRYTRWLILATGGFAAALTVATSLAATPTAGDTYVYRLVNGYTREIVAQVRHEITDASTTKGWVVSVSMDKPMPGQPRTDMTTADGKWLRYALDSHGIPVEYEFIQALPAYQPSLTPGTSWTARVNAKVPAENASRSVRIDGIVEGNERIKVPAGEFDTIRIRRTIYAGDKDFLRSETRIVETDWYAPVLGRSVRSESRSGWWVASCGRGTCDHRGDWNVLELVTAPR